MATADDLKTIMITAEVQRQDNDNSPSLCVNLKINIFRIPLWKEVSLRLIWIRMTMRCEKWVFVSPGIKRREQQRNFCEECLSSFRAGKNE